jgi:hypothetical protein
VVNRGSLPNGIHRRLHLQSPARFGDTLLNGRQAQFNSGETLLASYELNKQN